MNKRENQLPVFLGFAILVAMVTLPGNRSASAVTETATKFAQANQYYRDGEYEKAASAYEALAEKHSETGAFFFNLGNSYFRLGQTGKAVLAYENALKIDPRNADTRANLEYVRSLMEYRIQDKRNWYLQQVERLLNIVTREESLFVMLLAWFVFLLSWLFVLFVRRGLPWGWIRKLLLTLALLGTALYAGKCVQSDVIRDAVILVQDAEVRYGPSMSDQIVLHLGEGLKVYVLDRRSGWSRILLVNGESGWIKNTDLAEVRLR